MEKNYSLPENLVMRVCAHFGGKALSDADYSVEKDTCVCAKNLFIDLDKEYSTKSAIMGLTNEGIVERNCCPVHSNPGLVPVMKSVKANFKIGQGNVGFGSTFYAGDPSTCERRSDILCAQKEIGGFAILAQKYSDAAYVHEMAKLHILPLVLDDVDTGIVPNDSYILVKDIRTNLSAGKDPSVYLIGADGDLKQIPVTLAELSDEDKAILIQ